MRWHSCFTNPTGELRYDWTHLLDSLHLWQLTGLHVWPCSCSSNTQPANAALQLDGLICQLQVLQKQFATIEVAHLQLLQSCSLNLYLLKFKFNITPEAIYYLSQFKKKICSNSELEVVSTATTESADDTVILLVLCLPIKTLQDQTNTQTRYPEGHLTWTKARSCSLHSSHQTLWTSSSCTHESSHISQRWCSEQLQAFPISRLKTVERDQDRWNRLKAQSRVMMCLVLVESSRKLPAIMPAQLLWRDSLII